jgi:toxin ParE1/3/4
MPRYKLSKKAEHDLINIWNYTLDNWGETQADNYVQSLKSAVELLIENPELGKSRDGIRTGYRSYNLGKHVIFYCSCNYGIRVVRILHQSMDVGRHLL